MTVLNALLTLAREVATSGVSPTRTVEGNEVVFRPISDLVFGGTCYGSIKEKKGNALFVSIAL